MIVFAAYAVSRRSPLSASVDKSGEVRTGDWRAFLMRRVRRLPFPASREVLRSRASEGQDSCAQASGHFSSASLDEFRD